MTILERLQSHGIRRLGSKRSGFRYRTPRGRNVTRADLERIEALKVPPAWTQVRIHPSPSASVQAVGLDRAGRWQYRYRPAQTLRRERRKRDRLVRFIAALPRTRRTVTRDLARRGIPRRKVLAGILRILATCFLRPGSREYVDENGSYGITTLERRHVFVKGSRIRFDFTGKSKKRVERELHDPTLARLIRQLVRYPGEVFKFRAEDGGLVDVKRSHVNRYIKETMGEDFSAKDFRTWAGTLLCACALARRLVPEPTTAAALKRSVSDAIREVSEHLGNTPAVCRSSYVVPVVLHSFEEGRVIQSSFDHARELMNGSRSRIERSERALLKLLR